MDGPGEALLPLPVRRERVRSCWRLLFWRAAVPCRFVGTYGTGADVTE
jgi:hypothetical protein